MKSGVMVVVLVVGSLLFLVGGWFLVKMSVCNGLIDKDETVKEQWSQIDTQLQRRADLIPNLVNTVKGYAAHEKEIFTAVAEARSKLLAARGPAQKSAANTMLSGALGRLLAIGERYPDLKANVTFTRLQDELAGTENRIAVARTRYNNAVKQYNSAIRRFPGRLFAPKLGLEKAEYFEADERASKAAPPEVKF